MMKRTIIALMLVPIFCGGYLAAQSPADTDAGGAAAVQENTPGAGEAAAVKAEPGGNEAAPKADVQRKKGGKTERKQVEQANKTAAQEQGAAVETGATASGGLLEIEESDFVYRRIPEKKFPEIAQGGIEAFDDGSAIRTTTPDPEDPSQRKGLFGLSKRGTDIFARVVLVLIVLLIVVLYRMRSRTRRSTVHKSFR